MTYTSGGHTVETPSKLAVIGLPKKLSQWVERPKWDPQYRWSAKVLIPSEELNEFLREQEVQYTTYIQKRQNPSRDPYNECGKKWSYRLALRLSDHHQAALLMLHFRIPPKLVSLMSPSSFNGKKKKKEVAE